MKFLLDENFPLALHRRLHEAGIEAEHVILLGQRGIADSAILERLAAEELVFLTHDTEFEQLVTPGSKSQVIISRLPQRLPTGGASAWPRQVARRSRRDFRPEKGSPGFLMGVAARRANPGENP